MGTDPDLAFILRRWPQLPADIKRVIVQLVVECAPDPVGQRQRQQAALELAREIAGMLASETPKAGQPV
jgi:hypothetical protein